MRLHIAILAALVLASANASAVMESQMTSPGFRAVSHSHRVDKNAIQSKRQLRTANTMEENDEERGVTGIAFVDDWLQGRQIRSWLKSEKPIDEVFTLLKFDQKTGNIFESPKWKIWADYVVKLDSNDVDGSMVSVLTRIYKADKVSEMLAAAKKVPSTKELATRLEAAQLKSWLNFYGVTPDNRLIMLKLDKGADNLFDSPQFATWTKFLKAFNEKDLNEKTSVVGVFTRSYGEEGLMKMLVAGENAKSAGVTNVKNEMLQAWLDFTTSPNEVFKLLKLDKVGDGLLSSPLLGTWVQYMKLFNEKIPTKQTTMVVIFTRNYGDEGLAKMLEAAKKIPSTKEIATNLQNAQFSQWMTDKKTPKDILSVLKLDSKSLTNDPSSDIWWAYNKV